MPQFAANLGFLFQEVDLLARYNAAAGAGFRGVETPFPYRVPPRLALVTFGAWSDATTTLAQLAAKVTQWTSRWRCPLKPSINA